MHCRLLLWHESGIMKVLLTITGLSLNLYNAISCSVVIRDSSLQEVLYIQNFYVIDMLRGLNPNLHGSVKFFLTIYVSCVID